MHKKPVEMKASEKEPSEVVEAKIRDAAKEPFLPGIRDAWQSFKNKWPNDIDAKALGLKSKLSPEEAAIAIAGKAQEDRDMWKGRAIELAQANQVLRKENVLLQRRCKRYEKREEE